MPRVSHNHPSTRHIFIAAKSLAPNSSCPFVCRVQLSAYGRNALDVAGTAECAFLLRSLQNDDEDEESRLKAEAMRRRLELMMVRWSKASMVDGYKTWKDFALVPESKITRLVLTVGPPSCYIALCSRLLPPSVISRGRVPPLFRWRPSDGRRPMSPLSWASSRMRKARISTLTEHRLSSTTVERASGCWAAAGTRCSMAPKRHGQISAQTGPGLMSRR